MQEKYIRFQDAHIHYRVSGYGTPVVLLHGFGEDGNIWNRQIEFLQDQYRLIIPDLPGSGRSDLIREEGAGMETYAACIRQILDEESIPHCVMIGHSMGGYIALAYHELYGDSLLSWGLFHSTAFADSEEKKQTRKKAIEFILQHGAEAFLQTSIPGLFYSQESSNQMIRELVLKGQQFEAEALVQYYEAMINRPDRTSQLKESRRPVLLVLGEYDQAVPFKQGLEQCHMPERASVHILRNSGHMGMLEETQRSNEILAYFLHYQGMFNK